MVILLLLLPEVNLEGEKTSELHCTKCGKHFTHFLPLLYLKRPSSESLIKG